MKFNKKFSFVLTFGALIMVTNIAVGNEWLGAASSQFISLAPMVKRVLPSVVNISSSSPASNGNPLIDDPELSPIFDIPTESNPGTNSLGSGVVVNANLGYIITNSHVIQNQDKIRVTLFDGRSFLAKIIGTDAESDIAIIQVNADNLVAVKFANSRSIRVGDFVLAIGNTYGLGQSVSSGIVSALDRSGLGMKGFIQTDATINPGNTGGALLDLKGRLVGINTALMGSDGISVGISFAIPSNKAKEVLNQIVEFGSIRRKRLGIRVQAINSAMKTLYSLTSDKGVVIGHVAKQSAAEKAGLRIGDVITHINGIAILGPASVQDMLADFSGKKLQLSVISNKRSKTVMINYPKSPHHHIQLGGEQINKKLAGAIISNISAEHSLYGRVQGVILHRVFKGSPAWREGLRANDVIVSVNRQSISNIEEMRRAAKSRQDRTLLDIKRGDKALFVLVR